MSIDHDTPEQSPRSRSKRFRLISILVIVALAIGGGVFYALNLTGSAEADPGEEVTDSEASTEGEEEEKAPIPVEVAAVGTGTVTDYLSSTANLVAESEVRISAEAEGRVESLAIDEGAWVRKGQVMATLVKDEAEIAVSKARFREENARRARERIQELIDQELVSREEFDTARIEHEIALQELADAEWKLSKTTIRAPFSGRVSERIIQIGQHVRWGDDLFQITDFDPLIARIYLPEKDVLTLEEGREVRIALNADDSVRFTGRIRWISPVVDPETGTVKLTVEAVSPPGEVRPGSFVTLGIVRDTHERAVLLPRESVIRELKSSHIFVAEDEVAERREVTLGLEENDWVEVLSGVDAGEHVIVAGQGGLRDGAAVKALWQDGSPVHPDEDATEVADSDSDNAALDDDAPADDVREG